mmetsp:Transcript_16069/g.27121  ORF Transcript_16069/g.27121 Transcript_16069/m.27121 type:complete len:211 (+) Transcript_16069:399-1031(+)
MCNPLKVKNFLDFSGPDGWDPSLMGVMAAGVCFNAVSFHLLHKHKMEVVISSSFLKKHTTSTNTSNTTAATAVTSTATGSSNGDTDVSGSENSNIDKVTLNNVIRLFRHPANMKIDAHLIGGGVLFGIGWGMAGICPGPGIVNVGAGSRVSAAFIPFLLLGMVGHELYKTLPSISIQYFRCGTGSSDRSTVVPVNDTEFEKKEDNEAPPA